MRYLSVLNREIADECLPYLDGIEVTTLGTKPLREQLNGLVNVGTPGNCVGWMKGGYDEYILNTYGKQVEAEVRNHSPIAIGNSCTVSLDSMTRLVYTPTMEYPRDISETVNVMWAYLELFRWQGHHIFPLYGHGFGHLSIKEVCEQLMLAKRLSEGDKINSFEEMRKICQ